MSARAPVRAQDPSARPVAAAATLAAVALGSNLGDRRAHLERALASLARLPGTRLVAVSPLRETEPVGGPPQGRYLNGVALLETTLDARTLLAHLLALEREQGRVRGVKDGPRTLDLDLLLRGDEVVAEAGLELPHPRAHLREFVLEPLADVLPDWVHPREGRSVRALLAALRNGTARR